MKKLFVATITHEVIIVADDAFFAAAHASKLSASDYGEAEVDVTEMITLPADWDEEAIPFGDRAEGDPDRTVGAWVERGAAPAYAACRDMFRRQQQRIDAKKG